MNVRYTTEERVEAGNKLRSMLADGRPVYTCLRHVSRSGMQRCISLHVARDGGEIEDVTWLAARVLDRQTSSRWGGIVCNGAGMDMGWHLVYSLSAALYREEGEAWTEEAARRLTRRTL